MRRQRRPGMDGKTYGRRTLVALTTGGTNLRPSTFEVEAEVMNTRADCCSARATYRVVLPASPTRPEPAELLLCGHHLRSSRAALDACDARVYELDELFAALSV